MVNEHQRSYGSCCVGVERQFMYESTQRRDSLREVSRIRNNSWKVLRYHEACSENDQLWRTATGEGSARRRAITSDDGRGDV